MNTCMSQIHQWGRSMYFIGQEMYLFHFISFIMHSVNPYKVNQPIGYRVCHNVSVI